MLIRSMSAFDSPPHCVLTTVWRQMGFREGAHMPSMLRLANVFGNGMQAGVMLAYLFTLLAASMLLL